MFVEFPPNRGHGGCGASIHRRNRVVASEISEYGVFHLTEAGAVRRSGGGRTRMCGWDTLLRWTQWFRIVRAG
jgi:hypothetical protein